MRYCSSVLNGTVEFPTSKCDPQVILHGGKPGGTVDQLQKWGVCHQSMLRLLTQRAVGTVLVLRNLIAPVCVSVTWICYTIAEGT